MRKIFISVVINDSDFSEVAFFRWCNIHLKDSYKFEWKEIDTKELYEKDPAFRKIVKASSLANKIKKDYIHKNN